MDNANQEYDAIVNQIIDDSKYLEDASNKIDEIDYHRRQQNEFVNILYDKVSKLKDGIGGD